MKKEILNWEELINGFDGIVYADSHLRVELPSDIPLPKYNKMYLNEFFYVYSDYKEKPNFITQIIESIEDINDTDKIIIELSDGIHYTRDASLIRMYLNEKGISSVKIFSKEDPFNIYEVYKHKIIIVNRFIYEKNNLYDFVTNKDSKEDPMDACRNVVQITAVNHGVINLTNSNTLNSSRELYNILSSDFEILTNGVSTINVYGDFRQIALYVYKLEKYLNSFNINLKEAPSINKLKDYILELYNEGKYIPNRSFSTFDVIESKERSIDYTLTVEGYNKLKLSIVANSFYKKENDKELERSFEEEMKEVRDNLLKEYKKLTKESGCSPASYKGRTQLLEMIERANNCLK